MADMTGTTLTLILQNSKPQLYVIVSIFTRRIMFPLDDRLQEFQVFMPISFETFENTSAFF